MTKEKKCDDNSMAKGEKFELVNGLKVLKDFIGEIRWLNIYHASTKEELPLNIEEVPTS